MTKEQILQELEQLPEPILVKLLELARKLQAEEAEREAEVWQAYLASERERKEVYQRLANS
jgi:hypothetical protein